MTTDIAARLQRCTPYGLDDATLLADAAAELARLRNERDELRQLLMHMVKSYARWTPTRGHIQLEEQERALARFDQLSREWWRG